MIAARVSELADESVQMVVTSPPYWGLRKYAGEQDLIWGNVDHCEHEWVTKTKSMEYVQGNPEFARPHREKKNFAAQTNTCSKCGCWRGAFGLEPTPELYVQHTVEILMEVRRVLRKDGVVFWNIGDRYAGSGGAHKENHANPGLSNSFKRDGVPHYADEGMTAHYAPANFGLKAKDLCLIPFRVALAAQDSGWWVRSVIIWSKNNPMPESVKDRPTEAHEYILMLTKSANYYYDQEAVREAYSPTPRWGGDKYKGSVKDYENGEDDGLARERSCYPNSGRNLRSVWTFPTHGYSGAHFAVYPEELPERCIKAATPEVGCCAKCGAPYERIVEREQKDRSIPNGRSPDQYKANGEGGQAGYTSFVTLGWRPTCKCSAKKVPSLVLDPFAGSGTTLWVAKKLGRRAVGYEISEEYCTMALDRNRQMGFL